MLTSVFASRALFGRMDNVRQLVVGKLVRQEPLTLTQIGAIVLPSLSIIIIVRKEELAIESVSLLIIQMDTSEALQPLVSVFKGSGGTISTRNA